jgi:hypothetical protein
MSLGFWGSRVECILLSRGQRGRLPWEDSWRMGVNDPSGHGLLSTSINETVT